MKLTKTRLAAGGVLAAFAVAGVVGGSIAYASATQVPGVTIDAKADPAGAAKAMQLFDTATDRSFNPTIDTVYSQTKWDLASASSINNPPNSGKDVEQDLEATHTETSSSSIGGSVGGGWELKALGFANAKVSVKFSYGHQWDSQVSSATTVSAKAKPGKVVWIIASNSEVTFSGDYTFTTNGTKYKVTNVQITEPAPQPGSGGDKLTATTYAVYETDYGTVHDTADMAAAEVTDTPQVTPTGELPQLKTITDQIPTLKIAK